MRSALGDISNLSHQGQYKPQASHKDPNAAPSGINYTDRLIDSVHRNFRENESQNLVPRNHLYHVQGEITDKMRAILVDWLVDVHLKYKCAPETLYLAVNLLDRYLHKAPVEKKKLQLVGCVAMMLASKFEDINPPDVRDFVHISANTYTKGEMITMERTILVALDYYLTVPTLWHFLTQYLTDERTDLVRWGAEYLSEQTLMCGALVGFHPSLQAAAAVYVARRLLCVGETWTTELEKKTQYSEEQMSELIDMMDDNLLKVPKLKICAIRKKYSQSRYGGVSKLFDNAT
eukprot:TRINITY_DN8021_c1_g1_i1.p1 TRINITY_DN8021_c1_g1~~TRINITY_DN8021_c1_g1_i1.p1  ORF type:complete len:290 (+),score=46.89 TRINITY_DN8021_c1_g1_i1:98-967(+)